MSMNEEAMIYYGVVTGRFSSKNVNLSMPPSSCKDGYLVLASKLFNIPIEQVTKTQRDDAKRKFYLRVYGKRFDKAGVLKITKEEANKIYNKFLSQVGSNKNRGE